MPKLTLQFEGRMLKEYVVGPTVTIGRLPDNTVIIDNPAVSGHHARLVRDGDRVILEDLKSTNGTFVNEQHVMSHTLRHGDVVLIGKHTLVFDRTAGAETCAADPALPGLGDTVYLDTKQHRTLLATLRSAKAEADRAAGMWPTVSVPPAPAPLGVLRVIDGPADRPEYDLAAQTSLIGRSQTAVVRLRGWFKPDVAVAIARSGDGYVATRLGGKTLVNGQPLHERHPLKEGDRLYVSGVTLEFCLKSSVSASFAPSARELPRSPYMSAGERAATVRALT
ncbi:MAG: FHA domain-containing protein [Vicinamibacterales bacterium]